MNLVIIGGQLGADAEVKYTKNGKSFASLNIATREYQNGKNETMWHRVTLWGNEKVYDYLTKGKSVIVQGSLQNYAKEREDGSKEYKTTISAFRVELIGGGGEGGGGPRAARPAQKPIYTEEQKENYDDEIPF